MRASRSPRVLIRLSGFGVVCRCVALFFLLVGVILPAAIGWTQSALCALEISTDRPEYFPGQAVKVSFYLKVGDQEIKGARFALSVTPPIGGNFQIVTDPVINLARGFEGQGFLLSLPALTEQSERLSIQGIYKLRAQLEDPASHQVFCEGRTTFALRSVFGQQFFHKALIIAPPRSEFTESFATRIAMWLTAGYQTTVRTIYQQGLFLGYQKGDYKDYDLIVYDGLDAGQPPPPALLEDIFKGEGICKKKVAWLNYHLDRVPSELMSQIGFSYSEMEGKPGPAPMLYLPSNTSYDLLNPDRSYVKIQDNNLAQLLATVDGKGIVASSKHKQCPQDDPYFYYFGFQPTAWLKPFGAYLVFLDLLDEMLGIERGRTALVRLEDINAKTNPSDLFSVTSFLKSEKVPFTLALIPIYVKGSQVIKLSEASDFRTMVKKALLDGGQIVVHGATHQFGTGETAVDFEFYDQKSGKFVGGADYARERVTLALQEILQSGLAPNTVGWETPHYAASPEHYDVFEQYFGLLYEPVQAFNLDLLPFPIDTAHSTYVPTQLGYVAGDSTDSEIQRILQQAQLLAGLKHGALASFFYHPILGANRLKTLIQGLKNQGWAFQWVSAMARSTRIQFPPEGRR